MWRASRAAYLLGFLCSALGSFIWPFDLPFAPTWGAPVGGVLLCGGGSIVTVCFAVQNASLLCGCVVAAVELLAGGGVLLRYVPRWPPMVGGAVVGAGLLLGLGTAERAVYKRQPHKSGTVMALALASAGVAILRLGLPWAILGDGVHGSAGAERLAGFGSLGLGCAIGIVATGRSRRSGATGCCRGCALLLSAVAVGGGITVLGAREILPEGAGYALVGGGALLCLVAALAKGGGGRRSSSSAPAAALRRPLLSDDNLGGGLPLHRRQDSGMRRQVESLNAELDSTRVQLNLERQRNGASAATDASSAPPLPAVWQWQDEYGSWNRYAPEYCAQVNAAQARGDATLQLHVVANNTDYVLDLVALKQKNASTGVERDMRRVDPAELGGGGWGWGAGGAAPLPQTPREWSAEQKLFVVLSPSCDEGAAVVESFHRTLPRAQYAVEQVERVQNVVRWLAFASKKAILDNGLLRGGGANEQTVWHGAAEGVLDTIVHTGFNRDYSKRALYGRGTYFARDAKYSANAAYAVPNAAGAQFLLVVRILAGEPCVGSASMAEPTRKPRGQGELHESMVDNLANPSIYVLSSGTDDHAYPTYRVRFRKK
jgi:hypothetical protein